MPKGARYSLSDAAHLSAMLISLMFLIKLLELLLRVSLAGFGIVPRTSHGLVGIFFSPLLHGDMAHLVANALPLFVLLVLLFVDRRYFPVRTLGFIWLGSGLGTWLIGRNHAHGEIMVHIGASSLIYGLVAYLIMAGLIMKSWRAAGIALLVLIFYGGIFYGVLPQQGFISWEGHLSGAAVGVWVALRNQS